MSRTTSSSSVKNRPSPLSTKSFTRYEPAPTSPPLERSRASTVQSAVTVKPPKTTSEGGDVFAKLDEDEESVSPSFERKHSLPDRFDELPIELVSLTDRFVESLSQKQWKEPPSADQLSEIFQAFYERASTSISIHISALMSKINREASPAPSNSSSRSRAPSKQQSTDSLAAADRPSAQQMLTTSEVAERRKARRLLEYKRQVLEEAVEKRVCERIYDKIWRHKSTLDEMRDEKLRSKTAALALVGINLKDLGIDSNPKSGHTLEDVQESLTTAREGLAWMNDEHYPLGKLRHLQTAHKAIVETLSTVLGSSSSADDVLPTLIYTLVTSPIEGINIVSNLNFIERFRTSTKIDGEAAYCMTNLEAAISFLENVDLSALRSDEKPEGPGRTSSPLPPSPSIEKPEPFPQFSTTAPSPTKASISNNATGTLIEPTTTSKSSLEMNTSKRLPEPATTRHNRSLSSILEPITTAPATARASAEAGFANVSSTLDNSFKFLISKLRDRSEEDSHPETIVPKTLDEARALVFRPLTLQDGDDSTAISETSSITSKDDSSTTQAKLTTTDEKILSLFGGRKRTNSLRDRSVDSTRSNGSASGTTRKLAFTTAGDKTTIASQQQTATNPLDQVKNFSSQLNPINHISSTFSGAFRSFGQRTIPSPVQHAITPPQLATISTEKEKELTLRPPNKTELFAIKSNPPIARFVELGDVKELKMGEVEVLLREYQRLAGVLEGLRVVGEEEAGD